MPRIRTSPASPSAPSSPNTVIAESSRWRVAGLRFPATVNEWSARLVATGVITMAVAFLLTGSGWLLVPLTYGFAARVIAGPTLSPLGQLVTRVITPSLERRVGRTGRAVSGAPKRFAQGIGLAFTASASVAWLVGATNVAVALIAVLSIAAALEAGLGVCLGCMAYAALFGCADCDDISARLRAALASTSPDDAGGKGAQAAVADHAAPYASAVRSVTQR